MNKFISKIFNKIDIYSINKIYNLKIKLTYLKYKKNIYISYKYICTEKLKKNLNFNNGNENKLNENDILNENKKDEIEEKKYIKINEKEKLKYEKEESKFENEINKIYIEKQKEFVKQFEEEDDNIENSTVEIIKNNDSTNQNFFLNKEKYSNFIKIYNDEIKKRNILVEKKQNRFSQKKLDVDDKSLWQILKEKEDELKNKKKLKLYQKEIDEKMKNEYKKIKKEEKYFEKIQEKKIKKMKKEKNLNYENENDNNDLNLNEKCSYKKKNKNIKKELTYIDDDDIDMFLKNDKKNYNDIKTYNEIYENALKNVNENNLSVNFNKKQSDEVNNKIDKISNNELLEDNKNTYENIEENEFNLNEVIHDNIENEINYNTTKGYINKKQEYVSKILNNDININENNNKNIKDNLFIEETDNISAKKNIERILESKEKFLSLNENNKSININVKNGIGMNNENNINKKEKYLEIDKIKENNIKNINDKNDVISVNPSEIIKTVSGTSISTIIDSNIENLIIQREIRKGNNVNTIISVMYNNLKNCDKINLSTGIYKISKLIDPYQKENIITNQMFLCIVKKIEEMLSSFEMSNLVQVFYAFVKINYFPYYFNDIINQIYEKVDIKEPKQISSILYSLSNIIIETNESRKLKNKVIDLLKNNVNIFTNLNDIICLLTSLSKLKYKDVIIYYELSKKIEDQFDNLTIKNISNILWSFSNINYTSNLIKRIKKNIEKNIMDAHHIDIVNIIYSLTKLNELDIHLYTNVFFNAINIYIHNMNIKNLCIILYCYTYANIDLPELYINILTKVNENLKYITNKDIVSLITCLSKIEYNYKYKHLYKELKHKVIKNLYAFTPLQLTNIFYHSSFLDIYDHKYYYLLIQQIYQIRKLLLLENLTLILYALKNVCFLNIDNKDVFNLILYILNKIKNKYKYLIGEDCINIMLIINDLMKYTNQGYLIFTNDVDNKLINENNNISYDKKENNNLYLDIFDDNIKIDNISFSREEEIYLPHLNDLLYEQIKLRLNNYWQLNIKDVNNLLIIMKDYNMFDNAIINMIMRQIIPILLKSTNIEFLVFLSNISSNPNLKFLALTHLSRRPKLINVIRSKVNSITQSILNNFEEIENENNLIEFKTLEEKLNNSISYKTIDANENNNLNEKEIEQYENDKEKLNNENIQLETFSNLDNFSINKNVNKKKINKVDINSCISFCYACFNLNYEDNNILKMYDIIEHMILEEKKKINTYMLINFLYILTLTNNKIDFVKKITEEYIEYRYHYDFEKENKENKDINSQNDKTDEYNNEYETNQKNLSFNLFCDLNDKFHSYIKEGDEETSFILLKLLYINILLNNYKYLYHILSEICKYNDGIYSYEFIDIAKQVCYHIYNFTNFFLKNSININENFLWNKITNNLYVSEEKILLDMYFEKTDINLLHDENIIFNPYLKNEYVNISLDNNVNIGKFFYYILNYEKEYNNKSFNKNEITKKEKKKIKIFHFDYIIADILNFLKIPYKNLYIYENVYKIFCSFPNERHLIDLLSYEDVLFPSKRPLLSSEFRQKQLALKGWIVHSIHFRDLYNSIKDKNVVCYIYNIYKKIKNITDDEININEKDFWNNLKYTNIL